MPRTGPMISYAQQHEDVLLDRLFSDQSTGTYVDVGAFDPMVCSVTRHFYEKGWRGINIEPGAVFTRLQAGRPDDVNLNVAVSNRRGRMTFVEALGEPGMSGLAATLHASERGGERVEREVEVRTLRDIFSEHRPGAIDFMSVDVEGHEREVLEGNDWSRYRPRAVVVEATLPWSPVPCHERWEGVLVGAGYGFVYFDGLNRYYLRDEDRGLARHFSTPVNVFDNYKPAYIQQLETDLAKATAQAAEALSQAAVARCGQQHAEQQWSEVSRVVSDLADELARLRAGTGDRSLQLGLWLARCVARVGRLPRRLLRKAA